MDLPLAEARADGLVWAFAFPPGAPATEGEPRPPGSPGWDWLHFDLVNSRARAAIQAMAELPRFARQLLVNADETPRLTADSEAVAGVLPSFVRSGGKDAYDIIWWRFAMTPDRMVTGRRQPVRALTDVWDAARAGQPIDGPAALFCLTIGAFARAARRRLAALDEDLDATEEALLDQSAAADFGGLGSQLGQVRREMATIKRALSPLARLLGEDGAELPEWACHASQDTARGAVLGALDDIIALHDRAHSMQDELTARLAEDTNRRIYIVSVVTTVVMPATLVVGFFGMNTGGMLWASHDLGTLFALGVCIGAMLLTLLILRWKRLL